MIPRCPLGITILALLGLVLGSAPAMAQVPVAVAMPAATPSASSSTLSVTPLASNPTFFENTLPASAPPSTQPRGLLQQATSSNPLRDPFIPIMLGDFIGPVANLFSDVKIAEGESPRPMSRVFYKFNYFNNLNKDRFRDPTETIHNVDLYRHVFGFEQAFMDNSISLGLRIPFYTIDADAKEFIQAPITGRVRRSRRDDGLQTTQFGNVSAVLKALLWEDRETGSVLSGGATVSFPTASSQKINPGMSTVSFAQPYLGYIYANGDFFVQGFSSVTLSIASIQSIVLFNDIGVGYFVYRDASGSSTLKSVAPMLEVHVFTPLKQADPDRNLFGILDGFRLNDIVNVTLGTTFEFSNGATIGFGMVSPITGPKPFDIEALLQLNYRF